MICCKSQARTRIAIEKNGGGGKAGPPPPSIFYRKRNSSWLEKTEFWRSCLPPPSPSHTHILICFGEPVTYYKEISEIKIIISFKYFESPHLRIRILQIGLKGVGFFLWNSHIAFLFKSERRLAEFFFSSGSTFIKDNEYYLGFCSVIFLTLLSVSIAW